MIKELPSKRGWRLADDRRCLPGTREAFLDHIMNWIKNRESQRGLVLFGQAGTGKSSIAHEVARRLEETHHLASYIAFLRKEGSKDEAYQLFTTLARDLSYHYPHFKLALGRVLKNDLSLRITRNYRTLFERLLLEPVKDLQVEDPILIVIDALDESGDAIGQTGLHKFLAEHLVELPSNFRILITSRPENGIEDAFDKALSIGTLYMDDPDLAAKTEQDILLFLKEELPLDSYERHGVELAKAAESLFQWAAVASGFIKDPPPSFRYSRKLVIERLLRHSQDRNGQDPLDQLYREVLEGYFEASEAQTLFRSVMGQLFTAIEPLSIRSLIILRRHAPGGDPDDPDPEDSDCLVETLRHLGSLLSNVTSFSDLPIVPLHTSFRDFLVSEKSRDFRIDLLKAHRRLAHSCLALMLKNLKFNICELESSFLPNKDVEHLDCQIREHIPPALSYACVYWGDHLERLGIEQDLFPILRSLFETRFLFWLEVLSVKNSVGLASRALASLNTWLQSDQRKVGASYHVIRHVVTIG
jgi:hypothetical protein